MNRFLVFGLLVGICSANAEANASWLQITLPPHLTVSRIIWCIDSTHGQRSKALAGDCNPNDPESIGFPLYPTLRADIGAVRIEGNRVLVSAHAIGGALPSDEANLVVYGVTTDNGGTPLAVKRVFGFNKKEQPHQLVGAVDPTPPIDPTPIEDAKSEQQVAPTVAPIVAPMFETPAPISADGKYITPPETEPHQRQTASLGVILLTLLGGVCCMCLTIALLLAKRTKTGWRKWAKKRVNYMLGVDVKPRLLVNIDKNSSGDDKEEDYLILKQLGEGTNMAYDLNYSHYHL